MINKLGNYLVNTKVASVYGYDELSLQGLLSKFYEQMNKVTDVANEALDFLKWLKEIGLPLEVQKEIQKMYDDGRLADLINNVMFGEMNKKIDATNPLIFKFGGVGDGVANDSIALKAYYDDLVANNSENDEKVIIIPKGYEIKANLTITHPNFTITGGGIFNGTITIDVVNDFSNVKIDGITFRDTRQILPNQGTPIIYKTCRGGEVTNCVFKNVNKAISFLPYPGISGQPIARINVLGCYFDQNNYCLYGELSVGGSDIAIADIHFDNNICKWSDISTITFEIIDGISVSGNVMFMNQVFTKEHHVRIGRSSSWVKIENNNFFESGFESIKINNSNYTNIIGNNFAWCGQRRRCATIKLEQTLSGSPKLAYSSITGNNISLPSQYGIELNNVNNISVTSNNINMSTTTTPNYMGDLPLDPTRIFGVYIVNAYVGNLNIKVDNHINHPRFQYNVADGHILGEQKPLYTTEIDTLNVTQLSGNYDFVKINVNQSGIANIIGGTEGKTITIFSNTVVCTLVHNARTRLKGSQNYRMAIGDTITLVYRSNVWVELNRNEFNPVKTLNVVSGTTVVDLVNGESVLAVNNSSATTITNFTNGYVGEEVVVIAFNGNTTIEQGTNFSLKGSINATIPSGATMTFRYYSSRWFETGRSF